MMTDSPKKLNWFALLLEDIDHIQQHDPAAYSRLEVLLCYPGLHAVWAHRLLHKLWGLGFRLPARFLSQWVRRVTGIEIHPAARLGRRLFIDHGSGTVIGETARVGDDVTLYQGVTLGGTGKAKGRKRHPTLKNRITVGAGAKLLGNIMIEDDASIGAGSVVLKPVPAGATVVGIPATVVARYGQRVLKVNGRSSLVKSVQHMEQELNAMRLQLAVYQQQANSDEEEAESSQENDANAKASKEESLEPWQHPFQGEAI
jgi:serine O-acetyltransferase